MKDASSVPENITSPFEGPHLGLLQSTAFVNGHNLKVLFDDVSLISVVTRRLMNTLNAKTTETDLAAAMPDGRSHVPGEIIEHFKIHIGLKQE